MAQQIQLRRGTAAQWTTANPILAQGEMGVETDTGQFKIGNGSSTWSALSYGGLVGPAQTLAIQSFGDGSDGDVSLAAGVTTLARDMYYNNLTLSGTAKIISAGYRIFIKGTLDITAAGASAINFTGNDGIAAAAQTGAAAPTAQPAVMVGGSGAGSAGATGVVGVGAASAAPTAITPANGGAGGASGLGGTGTSGAGGAASAGGTVALPTPYRYFTYDLIRGVTLMLAGAGGRGGSSGAGDGVNLGRGGGSGGNAGGVLAIFAKNISRGASTAQGAIAAIGGLGGAGAASALGTNGGGSGAGGGGGGWIFLCYENLIGSAATNVLNASGGDGGSGGNAFSAPGTGGGGGSGGAGGRIFTLASGTNVGSETFGAAGSAGNPAVGLSGGTGGAGNLVKVSL